MQLQTFSRARKILGIRILPRAPTLQTYLFWPIGVNHATAKPSSSLNTYPIPDFFLKAVMQRDTFSRARKKKLKFLPIQPACSAFRSPGSHTTSKIPQWFLRHNPKAFLARVFRDAMSMADRDRRDKERGRLRRRRSKERDKERGRLRRAR